MAEPTLRVEVCWIGTDPPLRLAVAVPDGATVADAIAASGVVARLDRPLADLGVAVHGRAAEPAQRLHDGDRVELLPPLTVDPKVARERRAEWKRRQTGDARWTPGRR